MADEQNSQEQYRNPSRVISTPVGTSDWLFITQERIEAFAKATDDPQWIHLDAQRAATESPFGSTVAHGFLILSLLSHFINSAIMKEPVRMGVNYGLNRVRFITPVKVESRIRAHFKLLAADPIAAIAGIPGEQLTWEVTIESEGAEKPACVAEWITRVYV